MLAIINCAVILYTGDSEGTISKRGLGIKNRQTYVKYLINSLSLNFGCCSLILKKTCREVMGSQHLQDDHVFCAHTPTLFQKFVLKEFLQFLEVSNL